MIASLSDEQDDFEENIYLRYPSEEKRWKFVLQLHLRGKSVHGDLRMQISPEVLVGYTLNWVKKVPRDATSLSDAKQIIKPLLSQAWKILNNPLTKIVTELKKSEPVEWQTVEAEFPEGSVGASRFKKGYMVIVDKGEVEFGALKTSFREYFFHGEHMPPELTMRQLPNIWKQKSLHEGEVSKTGKGYTVWMTFASKFDAYAISSRAKKEGWYPPLNISALPRKIRAQIPAEYRYWKESSTKKAHELRDQLIDKIKSKEVILKYSESTDNLLGHNLSRFAKTKKRKPADPRVNKIKVPSKTVLAKIRKVLFYKPPKDLHFRWVVSKKETCPSCRWLAKNSPFPLDKLPTYPGEGKTMCGEKCNCKLRVVFPATDVWPQREYEIIPVKDKTLYESGWVEDWMADTLAKNYEKPIKPLWTEIMEELDMARDHVKALITDVKHMDRLDKAFMVFAGAPLIKDGLVAYKQAAREVYESLGLSAKEALHLSPQKQRKINQKILAVEVRLLNEGQVLEVEKQAGLMEDFMLEVLTSNVAAKTTSAFYKTLRALISKLKNFKSKGIVGKIIKSATTEARKKQTEEVTKNIKELRAHTTSFIEDLKQWGPKIGAKILDEIDYFVTFWKDTVLIGTTGTAVRNMADNTLKAANEMINSLFKGKPFWAFYTGKNKQILNIPEAVAKQSWAREAGDYAHLDAMGKVGINWWERMRKFLYESLLEKPEKWARKGLYAGKLTQYQKTLKTLGRNPKDYDELLKMKKNAIEEVNRVFFDYSKKMQIEVPLSRIFPFEVYNIRNFNYWLKDFAEHPWKLGAIRAIWHWWEKRGANMEFKLKDKIPLYLVPGIYFNPMSWLSAFKFVKLFAWYKGDPKWVTARDAHVNWLSQQVKYLPPDAALRVLSKAQLKNVTEFENRQKFKWVKIGVEFLDDWLGLLPPWKKVLAQLHLAEKEEWKTMFPQTQLISAVSSSMLNTFWGTIKPPGRTVLNDIYKIMRVQGVSELKKVEDEIKAGTLVGDPEVFIKEAKEKDRAAADRIYRAWQLQKIVVGYFTGMWLTKSWGDIYKLHKSLLEEMESK